MPTPLVFNINDCVRIRLTARGRKIHRAEHAMFCRELPYRTPDEDAQGWSRWQIWRLLELFGPHTHMGFDPCFETNIEIEIEIKE